ncbi:MAG: hypothetical protein GY754_27340 [bacterium]|nr:hypothetical protein [bacterium]
MRKRFSGSVAGLILFTVFILTGCEAALTGSSDISEEGFSFSDIYKNMQLMQAEIESLKTAIEIRDSIIPPVGAIQAWHKNLTHTPVLPEGWAECNGAPVDDPGSVYHGMNTPNLNGEGRFLRGSSGSGTLQEGATALPVSGFTTNTDTHSHRYTDPYVSGHSYKANGNGEGIFEYPTGNGGTTTSDSHNHTIQGGDSETRPVNMSVVWIIRIK